MPPKSIPIVSAAEQRQRRRAGPKGRAGDAAALAEVQQLLGSDSRARPLLIEHLHKLQDHFGHLGERHLAALASEMRLSQAEVYEVASFYHHFDIVKEGEAAPPRLTVRVCDSLSCELAGARALLERLPGLLGTQVRVLAVPCIGRCEQAPAAALGQLALAAATPASVQAAVESALQADGPAARPLARPPQAALDFDAYRAAGGYALLGACVAGTRSTEQVIGALEHSGLRGLGGAGFPAGRKWRIVRAEPAPRLMAVNIDEGEPGTFKDRHYLERDPHRFIEGLLIAAWAVGIARVYIYLRDEYHDCRALLERELARAARRPALAGHAAHRAATWRRRLHLRRGVGHDRVDRGQARHAAAAPALRGPGRAVRPADAGTQLRDAVLGARHRREGWPGFAAHGRHGRQGLRSFSVSGRVREPGVKLAPAGITVRELVAEYCGGMAEGHRFHAYLPGGASGGILPASLGDIPLDFDTLQPYGCFIGSAAVIVLSDQDRVVDAARNLMRFFRHESCGQCTPCRNGTARPPS
jgi:NADH:ubiquinone oxidoreductase subunit F (NADH-binding)/NADH:ubiquinone oxidoreductase subunit E